MQGMCEAHGIMSADNRSLKLFLFRGKNMKKRNKILAICCGAAALGMALAVPVTMQAKEADTIADGVYIGNIYVGGMTEEEAVAAVDAYIAGACTGFFLFVPTEYISE